MIRRDATTRDRSLITRELATAAARSDVRRRGSLI